MTPTANAKDIPGSKIESFVQLPPEFDKTKKYPLILNIHGGPHSAYGWVFDHEMQWMAAKGYVVVYPNPRGSTTYGQQFANVIQHNYPGDDFHDLMDCVDAVVKLGYVDPAKMGVTGGSGGGLLTDWTVTQTTGSRRRWRSGISRTGRTGGTRRTLRCFSRRGLRARRSTRWRSSRSTRRLLISRSADADDVHPGRGGLSHAADGRW